MKNKNKFLEKCNLKFNNKFDYSLVDDTKLVEDIHTIICPIHGPFDITLKAHYRSKEGCPKCNIEARKKFKLDIVQNDINTLDSIIKDLIITNPIIADKDRCIGSVYIFINKQNHKIYVGKTISSYLSRFNEHKYHAFTSKDVNYFYNALRKYGWDNFNKYIIYQTNLDSINNKNIIDTLICEKEQEFIKKFKTSNSKYGYNLTIGGDGICGYIFSEEAKQKMSENKKGEKHHNYGKRGKDSTYAIPIYQFDKNFNFIKEWDCTASAAKELNLNSPNITRCITSKTGSAGGYLWVKKSEYFDGYFQKYNPNPNKISNDKTVLQYSCTGEFIKEYQSAAEAARNLHCDGSTISGAAKGKFTHGKHFIWIYKKDFTKELLKNKINNYNNR